MEVRTPIAGSIFGLPFLSFFQQWDFKNRNMTSALLISNWREFCFRGVVSFITHIPEWEHSIEKRFHGLFTEKEDYWGLAFLIEVEVT